MADATVKRVKVELSGSSQSLQSAVQKAKDSLKGFDKQQQKTASFASKLAKIMEYRLIRGGISKIIQGLEEGKKAIEAYDKALNGMSASKASSLMKEMAENTTLLHNTLASLFMTVYASVQPAINALVEVLRTAMNTINQVISALIGRTTYTKAVKGWNSVTDAVKAYKKQIFGFDELNILKAPDGDNAPDYSGAFEETDISPFLQKIGEAMAKVRENLKSVAEVIDWDDVWQKVGAIGGAIALWKVGESLLNFVKTITANPVYEIAIGATLVVSGFEGLNDAIEDALTNGPNKDNIAAMLLSSGAIIGGGYMVGKALGDSMMGAAFATISIGGVMIWKGLNEALDDGMSPVEGFLITTGSAIIGATFGALFGPVGAGVGALVGLLIGGFTTFEVYQKNKQKGIVQEMDHWLSDVKIKIATWYFNLYDQFPKWLQNFLDALGVFRKDAIENELTPLANAIKNVLSLINELKGGALGEGIRSVRNILGFANGGFPTQGDLFIANEAGPELVGSFGNRTGVYNQEQFAGAMASANAAVVQAVYAIGSQITGAVNNKPVPSVKIGDRDIFSASQRGATLAGSSLIQGGRS